METKARPNLREFAGSSWHGKAQYDGLDSVVMAIAKGTQLVQKKVRAAKLVEALGTTGDTNVQGEAVQRLDIISSDIFVSAFRQSRRVAAVGCEELEAPVFIGDGTRHSFIVLMDPLDGSSNIDVAVSIGSIFGVWRRKGSDPVTESSLLRPGREQVAAAYVVYGSSTMLVVATRNSVHGFTLDNTRGVFTLTHEDIQIPKKCSYYSINESNFKILDESTKQAVTNLRDCYSQRYVGSLVADFHRNLLKGGVFLYPMDEERPEGKLRLMYEANPLGFVAEQAGGAASTGGRRIMDIIPEKLHQRTPLILGNKDVVEQIEQVISMGRSQFLSRGH